MQTKITQILINWWAKRVIWRNQVTPVTY